MSDASQCLKNLNDIFQALKFCGIPDLRTLVRKPIIVYIPQQSIGNTGPLKTIYKETFDTFVNHCFGATLNSFFVSENIVSKDSPEGHRSYGIQLSTNLSLCGKKINIWNSLKSERGAGLKAGEFSLENLVIGLLTGSSNADASVFIIGSLTLNAGDTPFQTVVETTQLNCFIYSASENFNPTPNQSKSQET